MLSLYEALSYNNEDYIQEGFFDRFRKKSRWERFKDKIRNNKGKLLGALALGAGAYVKTGHDNYTKLRDKKLKAAGYEKDGKSGFSKRYGNYYKDNNDGSFDYVDLTYNPFRRYSDDNAKISGVVRRISNLEQDPKDKMIKHDVTKPKHIEL